MRDARHRILAKGLRKKKEVGFVNDVILLYLGEFLITYLIFVVTKKKRPLGANQHAVETSCSCVPTPRRSLKYLTRQPEKTDMKGIQLLRYVCFNPFVQLTSLIFHPKLTDSYHPLKLLKTSESRQLLSPSRGGDPEESRHGSKTNYIAPCTTV